VFGWMLMLIADYTRKSSKGMAGAAKRAARCADLKSITSSAEANQAMIRKAISLRCAQAVTKQFTRDAADGCQNRDD